MSEGSNRTCLLLACLVMTGCYRPKIADGSFRCGSNGLCPQGYSCNAEMLCINDATPVDMQSERGTVSGQG